MNGFLWLPGEAIFHFLPVGITWSIAKKMGTTQILGIVLGITLVSPQLLNAYSVASTAAADIPFWDFGFAQVEMIGYQAQVSQPCWQVSCWLISKFSSVSIFLSPFR